MIFLLFIFGTIFFTNTSDKLLITKYVNSIPIYVPFSFGTFKWKFYRRQENKNSYIIHLTSHQKSLYTWFLSLVKLKFCNSLIYIYKFPILFIFSCVFFHSVYILKFMLLFLCGFFFIFLLYTHVHIQCNVYVTKLWTYIFWVWFFAFV